MTRISTRSRLLLILLALVTASAVLIVISGSEASANPDGKTYTATIDAPETTAGVLNSHTLTVTNTSDSTPLGAVNLGMVPEIVVNDTSQCSSDVVDPQFWFDGIPEDAGTIWAGDGTKEWSVRWDSGTDTIELRAIDSSDRLDANESVQVAFELTVLQQSIASEECVDYAFPIDARQANSFAGEPGNGLTYEPEPGKSASGPELRVWHVAQRCTVGTENCALSQGLGDNTEAIFSLTGTCDQVDVDEYGRDRGCGIIAIELVSDGTILSSGQIAYTPAPDSTDVRAHLTLPKSVLTKSASRYTFDLYYLVDGYTEDEDGDLVFHAAGELKEADLSKCRRGDTNCIEAIERTKTDVTWIFRVDSLDPRMDYN